MNNDYLQVLLGTLRNSTGGGTSLDKVCHITDTKKVRKGWGEERWLVNTSAPFGFKLIHIAAGQKTSLQYHERKEEANFVVRGAGLLYFSNAHGEPLRQIPFSAGDIAHIRPGNVHRIEAIEDITLVEVSTPDLDDVIRLQDDWSRGNGRIDAEHQVEG